MLSWKQWNSQILEQQDNKSEQGVNNQWDKLIDDHRVKFDSKFDQFKLTVDDKLLVVNFLSRFKFTKQTNNKNIFETKIGGVVFQLAYFGNKQWAASITTDKTREVTKLFTVTENKVASLLDLFDKAIKAQSFIDILPLATK